MCVCNVRLDDGKLCDIERSHTLKEILSFGFWVQAVELYHENNSRPSQHESSAAKDSLCLMKAGIAIRETKAKLQKGEGVCSDKVVWCTDVNNFSMKNQISNAERPVWRGRKQNRIFFFFPCAGCMVEHLRATRPAWSSMLQKHKRRRWDESFKHESK